MKSKKYYVVWEGRKKGVFESWDECKEQVNKYSGAEFKSFKTKEEAKKAFKGVSSDYIYFWNRRKCVDDPRFLVGY